MQIEQISADWTAGIVHLSSKLKFVVRNAMDDWANEMRTLGQAFATLEPLLTHASEIVREELRELTVIEEGDLRVRFEGKINEYKKVRFVHGSSGIATRQNASHETTLTLTSHHLLNNYRRRRTSRFSRRLTKRMPKTQRIYPMI